MSSYQSDKDIFQNTKEGVGSAWSYKNPRFWILVAIIACGVIVAFIFANSTTVFTQNRNVGMYGNNVSDIVPESIIGDIQRIEKLDDENLYVNPQVNHFSLHVDEEFNWCFPGTVQYFFEKDSNTYSAQLQIFNNENGFYVTEPSKTYKQETKSLLYHYLQAVRFLPQTEIRRLAPADRYDIFLSDEGVPSDYPNAITYSSNGVGNIDKQYVHIRLMPLHKSKKSDSYDGGEVVNLFFGEATLPHKN